MRAETSGRLLLALFLAVPWAPSAWAAQAASRPAAVRATAPPLVRLGSLIAAAAPKGFDPQTLALAGSSGLGLPPEQAKRLPSALDTRKTAVLWQRAREIKPAPAAISHQTGELPSAPRLVEAVNSVLKDIEPEELEKMPSERLHALSGLIFDQMQVKRRASPARDLSAMAVVSQARMRKLLELRKKPAEETLLNPGHNESHGDDILVRGVPPETRVVLPEAESGLDLWVRHKAVPIDGQTVFRHFTTKEGVREILSSKRLWNGFLPYVQLSKALFRKSFDAVTGVFFTLPGVEGDRVGVPEKDFDHYVDVRLPANLPLVELEPGMIYMVPLPNRTRDWVLEYYRQWAQTGTIKDGAKDYYVGMVREIESEGGPGPSLAIPVQIVGKGRAR